VEERFDKGVLRDVLSGMPIPHEEGHASYYIWVETAKLNIETGRLGQRWTYALFPTHHIMYTHQRRDSFT
jgi:hypothetical protein